MKYPRQSRHFLSKTAFVIVVTALIYTCIDVLVRNSDTLINAFSRSRRFDGGQGNSDSVISDRTLVIINGELRDFLQVWNWTYTRLVLPNEPCDVIFSIDGSRAEIPEVILKGFGAHVTAILTTETETPTGHIDFWMTAHAVRKIQAERYKYLIKTRPDLFHRLPLPMKTIYGNNPDFIEYFRRFHRNLTRTTHRTNFTVAETLYAWIMTAGLTELIPTMIMRTPTTVWGKLAPNDWNKNVRLALIESCNASGLITFDRDAKNEREIVRILKMVLAKYKVVYNFGGNWIQFGPAEHMIPLSIKTADEFTQHTWADVGYNDSDYYSYNQYRHVGESQMRLTHLKGGYNLVDILVEADLLQSFAINKTFRQAMTENYGMFFIARSKERFMAKWNLTDPTKVEYW